MRSIPTRTTGAARGVLGLPARVSEWAGKRAVRTRVIALVVLGVLVAGAGVSVAVVYFWSYRPAQQTEQARGDGLAAAGELTKQVLSFSPQTLDADLDHARRRIAPSFVAQFEQLSQQVIAPTVHQGLVLESKVARGSVISAEPDQVVTLLFIEQNSTTAGQPPQTRLSRAQVTVSRISGEWLISDLRPI